MQVVILCGGLGTRLREETEFRPKPMVNIGNRPILWHVMKIYSYYGYKDFILTLGYKGEMIKDYFCHYEIMNNDVTIELGKSESMHIHNSHDEVGWKITLAETGKKSVSPSRARLTASLKSAKAILPSGFCTFGASVVLPISMIFW